jgi:hypothetical protein
MCVSTSAVSSAPAVAPDFLQEIFTGLDGSLFADEEGEELEALRWT